MLRLALAERLGHRFHYPGGTTITTLDFAAAVKNCDPAAEIDCFENAPRWSSDALSAGNLNASGKDSDMDDRLLQRAYDLGYEFERKYHGCTQCVIAAVYQIFPAMRSEDIFRAANAQAGGMGLTSMGQCGAAVGAGMIISQLYGRSLGDIGDPEKKRFVAYRLGQEFANRFSEEMGSLICGEIQEKMMGRRFNLLKTPDWEAFEKTGGHDRHCPVVVGTATRIVVEMLLEKETEGQWHP